MDFTNSNLHPSNFEVATLDPGRLVLQILALEVPAETGQPLFVQLTRRSLMVSWSFLAMPEVWAPDPNQRIGRQDWS